MRTGKLFIFILTGFLLCTLVFAGVKEAQGDFPLTAQADWNGQTVTLGCWETYDGRAYIFLPSFVDTEQVVLRTPKDGVYRIDGEPVTDGMSCSRFQLDTAYSFQAESYAAIQAREIFFLRSGGVSTLMLDVSSGSMHYLHEDKQHTEPGKIRLYTQEGELSYSGTADSVGGRGQSTWEDWKKSYKFRLSQEADLMGMGHAEKWILLSGSKDPTSMRNKLVLDYAREAGLAYSPEAQWVDLYLNGNYAGLYLLCERNEVHPNRVAISGEGSFLVSKDWQWRFENESEPYVMTRSNAALGIHYNTISQEQLQQLWQSVDNAILAEDGIDPVSGKSWLELINLESWVSKYLIEEIFGNEDGSSLSQYYYRNGDGPICAGPVWDYDLTMRTQANEIHGARQWLYGSRWPYALYQKPEFRQEVRRQYETKFRPLLQTLISQGISGYDRQIAGANRTNAVRWYLGDITEYVDGLGAYLEARMALLDDLWLNGETYYRLSITDELDTTREYWQKADSALPELPQVADTESYRVLGWYYQGSEEPVRSGDTLREDTRIYLKTEAYPPAEAAADTQPVMEAENAKPGLLDGFRLTQVFPVLVLAGLMGCLVLAELLRRKPHSRKKETVTKG